MSHKDYIGNAGHIKRAGIAETVIIKLDRQREFFAERGEFFSFKTGIPGGLDVRVENTHNSSRICCTAPL